MAHTIAGVELEEVVFLLHQRIISLLQNNKSRPQERLLIALAGVPGSGKSTVSAALMKTLSKHGINNVAVLPMDGYHYSKKTLCTFEDPTFAFLRRGAPFTFDVDALLEMILSLKTLPVTSFEHETVAARAPSFDHAVQDPVHDSISISSSDKIVIVEGNYLLLNESPWNKIAAMADERWFVDSPPEVAKQRLIARHLQAGIEQNVDAAAARAEENDIPNGDLIRANLIRPHVTIVN